MGILKALIYCENAVQIPQANGEAKLVLTQPFFSIQLGFFPTMYSFNIVIGTEDIKVGDCLRAVFRNNDDGQTVVDADGFRVPAVDAAGSGVSLPSAMLNIQLQNVLFNVPGEYETEVFLNGESIGKYPIAVRRVV